MAKQNPSRKTQTTQSFTAVILSKVYYLASKAFVIFPAISLEELQWGEAFSAEWFGMLGCYTLAGLVFFCLLQWLIDWLNSRAQKLADANCVQDGTDRRKPKATLRTVVGRTMTAISGGFLIMAVVIPLLIGLSDGFDDVLSVSTLAVIIYSLGLWLLTRFLGRKLLRIQKTQKKVTVPKG